jgi:hypothetical protein
LPGEHLPLIEGRANVGLEPMTPQALGTVSLNREAERERLSVDDQIKQRDAELREWMANRVVPSFLWANGLILGALAILVALDEINISLHMIAPGDRIITSRVIMALLGATTVQVGTIAVLIARYLFPGRARDG